MQQRTILATCLCFLFNVVIAQQPKLMLPVGHSGPVKSAEFNADGKMILTVSNDGTAKLWETATGKLVYDFRPEGDASMVTVSQAGFSPDGNKIFLNYENSYTKIFDIRSGLFFNDENSNSFSNTWEVSSSHVFDQVSPDGKYIVLFGDEQGAVICDLDTRDTAKLLKTGGKRISLATYSYDGKWVVTFTDNRVTGSDGIIRMAPEDNFTVILWDALTAKKIWSIGSKEAELESASFSPDNKKLLLVKNNDAAIMLNAVTGKKLFDIKGNASAWEDHQFSPDSKKLIQVDNQFYSTWDITTGKLLWKTARDSFNLMNFSFSPDSKQVIITESVYEESWNGLSELSSIVKNNKSVVRDVSTGKILFVLNKQGNIINDACYSPDGKSIFTATTDNKIGIFDAATGKLKTQLAGHNAPVLNISFSRDGKRMASASADLTVKLWDMKTLTPLRSLTGHTNNFKYARFSSDGKQIILVSKSGSKSLDVESGKMIDIHQDTTSIDKSPLSGDVTKYSPDNMYAVYWAVNYLNVYKVQTDSASGEKIMGEGISLTEKEIVSTVQFSPDSKKIIITYQNSRVRIYDIEHERYLMMVIAVDSSDYLITDDQNHYDGSESARKLLYFTCGTEIIELDQVKDQLWIPNLAYRIINREIINARTLDDLNICDLTPAVEDKTNDSVMYHFSITARKGGLGETILSINGTPTRTYKPVQLKKTGNTYDLFIPKEDLNTYFIAGEENLVTVKAYTADNTISSRGSVITVNSQAQNTIPPNLYAVMVGVSDYKGDELDLKYAAKDANDISIAISAAARKLLNTDGKDHVFMYNLTTAKDHYLLPEKNSIKKVLDEIGQKATANDILLIFFAGHGIMAGQADEKQFYFLTADASTLASNFAVKDVGISTMELSEWMKPAVMKAQKRILIFDACNSGQAINDIAGADLAIRDDSKTQQIKAIDKLNEKSGLFILSASATNQSAYEIGRYSQGLLTYSLLKAIKQQPDILEDGKYLNISRWFNAAEKTVSELTREYGSNRQEPQIVTNTNFNIGIVDGEVMDKIVLPSERPLFSTSNFQNSDENIAIDNLELNKLTDNKLQEMSAAVNGAISFINNTKQPDAYALGGRYDVSGKTITAKVVIRQGTEIRFRFQVTGSTDKLDELAAAIAAQAIATMKR